MHQAAAEQPRRHPFRLALLARAALVTLLVGLVRLYQRVIAPGLRPRCRFLPSCSEYAVQSLHKHGPFKGSARALWRICRCHPFGKTGYDPP